MDKSYTLNLTREELISLSFFIDQSFIESLKTNENKSLKTMEYIVDIANIYNTLRSMLAECAEEIKEEVETRALS